MRAVSKLETKDEVGLEAVQVNTGTCAEAFSSIGDAAGVDGHLAVNPYTVHPVGDNSFAGVLSAEEWEAALQPTAPLAVTRVVIKLRGPSSFIVDDSVFMSNTML